MSEKYQEGMKFDDSKPPMELISPIALEQLARVLEFGAKKYEPYNWAKGIRYTRILGGILRHVFAYIRGESIDPETGLSHIAHAMTGCMFILHYEKMRPEFDDRAKNAYTKSVIVNSDNS